MTNEIQQVFRTTDGRIWENQDTAEIHQSNLTEQSNLLHYLNSNDCCASDDDMLDIIKTLQLKYEITEKEKTG